jgi:type IV secretion system protein VirB6
MDCHIQAAVQSGYERLFGQGGALAATLTGLLTLYIALIAYGFLTGRTRLTLGMMSPRAVTLVLVLSFLSVYPAYHALFFGLLMNGPDEITAALLGQRGHSAIYNFADQLDGLFVRFANVATSLDQTNANGAGIVNSQSMPVTLFWLSGLILLMSTLGVLILSRLVLYLMLILGPIFILLALFPQTRGLFNGWLRTAFVFAIMPMLTVLGGTAALMMFVPLIDAISFDPQGAVKRVQPMVMLFMGSLIYAGFMLVLFWVAASLVRDWQAAMRNDPPLTPEPQTLQANQTVNMGGTLMALGAAGAASSMGRSDPVVMALNQSGQTTENRSNSINSVMLNEGSVSKDRFSRVEGLGSRFRQAKGGATMGLTKTSAPTVSGGER